MNESAKLWTSNFVFVCLVRLCNSIAFTGLNVSLPLYITKLGGHASLAGLAMAFLTIAAVIIRPFTGIALDNYGRKMIMTGGLFLFLLPSLTYIFIVPFSVLLVFRFIQGLGWGIFHTTVGTIASDVVPPVRMAEGMGTYNITASISSALAPLMSIWLINQFEFRTFFIVIFLLTVASTIFSQGIEYSDLATFPQKHKAELASRKAMRPTVVVLLMGVAQSAVLSFLALFATDAGISNPGVFFAFMGMTALISKPLSGKFLDQRGNRGYDLALFITVPLVTVALWIVALTGTTWQLALSGAIFGMGLGINQSAMLALTIKLLPDNRGLANALYGTFLDIGVAVGSILWGIVANLLGYHTMFRLATIPVILCLLVFFFKRGKDSEKKAGSYCFTPYSSKNAE